VIVMPVATLVAARSGTFFSPARCLDPCWFPCIICGSTNGWWRTSAVRSAEENLHSFAGPTRVVASARLRVLWALIRQKPNRSPMKKGTSL